jgi:hypothetical protein
METLRRRLRPVAMIWLLLQGLQFSTFVPLDCCLKHRAASQQTSCHHPAPPVACSLDSGCPGPLASLLVLLSNQGILPSPMNVIDQMMWAPLPSSGSVAVVRLLERPDPPPPRL